ncbi:hypothetical protein DPX16_19225 [Anabarilius grahami]|uniref:Uncharacterized protein n=2 Tax=Xenocypridinae TaxID=2743747 RepID=A0A3N0YZI0_ANAGA|nr:hypothetical protein DPX16_19225 [Anabarilius grahami]
MCGGEELCASQGMGFCGGGMGELLDAGDNTISPEAETPACIYTGAVAALAPHTDMSAGTRTAVTAGHRHAALCPPGHCWQPLITGVMWACQPDHTERCVSHSAGKVSKTLASALNDGLAGWLVKSIPQRFLRSLWLSEREQPEGRVSGRPEPEAVPWSPATHSASCQRAKRENKCSAIL